MTREVPIAANKVELLDEMLRHGSNPPVSQALRDLEAADLIVLDRKRWKLTRAGHRRLVVAQARLL